MAIPTQIGALLDRFDTSGLPGTVNRNDQCEGAKFHSPSPLLVRQVRLAPEAWEGESEWLWLCPTCEANLRVYQFLMEQTKGEMEWPAKREFGNLIRALGNKSWEQEWGQGVSG